LKANTLAVLFSQSAAMLYGGAFLLFIPFYLNIEDQGFWFTLMALGAMSRLADMGFLNLVMTYVAHAKEGKDFALLDVIAFSFLWRNKVLLFIFPVIFLIGVAVLWMQSNAAILFIAWLWYVLTLALIFALYQKLAVVEGLGDIGRSHCYKGSLYILATLFSLLLIIYLENVLALPFGLFLAVIMVYAHAHFAIKLPHHSDVASENRQRLSDEFRVLIKQTSLSWVGGYIGTQGIVPIVYATMGPSVSGVVGMTLNVFVAIQNLANVFLLSIAPKVTQLVASNQIKDAMEIMKFGLQRSLLSFLLTSVFFIVIAHVWSDSFVFSRLLTDNNLYFLAAAFLLQIMITAMAIFIRAYKVEPLGAMSFVSSVVGLFVMWGSITMLGSSGVFLGFLASSALAFFWTLVIVKQGSFIIGK
jgi:hypothetical protein